MDQQRLRNLVFEKTGVRVDSDDPIFALVALNEVVLAEAVERHVALIDAATRELALQARAIAAGVGVGVGVGVLPPAAAQRALPAPPVPLEPPRHDVRLLAGAAAVALFSALLVLAGQALFFKPAPAPSILARSLTQQESAAIMHGEKLEKVVQKLDQKTRQLIQLEMQKP